MKLKECLEMIYVACTNYDKEITRKLGTEREYEGSYEQAYNTVLEELNKKDKLYNKALTDLVKAEKVIDLIVESWKQDDIRSVKEIKEYFYKKVEEENE